MEKGCSGYCRTCCCEHYLPVEPARRACLELMALLESEQRLDLHIPAYQTNPKLSTSPLFGTGRGKMFGVMVAQTAAGDTRILRAFSGQYNGIWLIPGWVGPVFDLDEFHQVQDAQERGIKNLGRQIKKTTPGSSQQQELIHRRKQYSRQLMKEIHKLYRLTNFCGQQAGLSEIFGPQLGIPTGTGDCCAPKLLQYAVHHELIPISIAEFFWGRENVSATRQHRGFYPPCRSKCAPLLGFILCGLNAPGND